MNGSMKMVIAIAAAMLCSTLATSGQQVHIRGDIKGMGDGEFVIMFREGAVSKTDKVKVVQDKFTWTASMPYPQKIQLNFPRRGVTAYVESGVIEMNGHIDSLKMIRITGSKIQMEADAYEQLLQPVTEQEGPLYQKYGKVNKDEQLKIEQKLQGIKQQKRALVEHYITQKPESVFSLMLVSERALLGDYASIKPLFDKLGDSVKLIPEGKLLADRLTFLKRSEIGATIINFTQNDTDGKPVSFSTFRGKYVLIDFWASWCGPCRAENPNVLKAYNKYKDQNFTVVGISLDDKEENWKKAIQEDGMPWTQLSDLKGRNNEVCKYYGIWGIPSTLLIDPQGIIIAKDLRREMLNRKLEEIFGN